MTQEEQLPQQIGIQSNSGGDINIEHSQVHIAGRDMIIYQASGEPEINLEEAEKAYRQKIVETYKWLNFSGFDTPDLSLAHVPLENIFVRLALTVEKVIPKPTQPEKPSRGREREDQRWEQVRIEHEPIELDQALGNHALIVGEPGA